MDARYVKEKGIVRAEIIPFNGSDLDDLLPDFCKDGRHDEYYTIKFFNTEDRCVAQEMITNEFTRTFSDNPKYAKKDKI